jgi:hypothetical protein
MRVSDMALADMIRLTLLLYLPAILDRDSPETIKWVTISSLAPSSKEAGIAGTGDATETYSDTGATARLPYPAGPLG